MRNLLGIFSSIIMLFLLACDNPEVRLNVMTFNVRYDNPNDGANRWELRVPLIEKYLKEEMPDIVGMQEVRHNQVLDLMKIMPGYSYVGSGRDDGKQGGEYTPVFYREDIFNLLEDSQFWLSETPEAPGSKSWDAAIT
ncbi:MAG TPA: endonuclease/exonuclease/phosphatase family protein, partial [Mariniphaga sp.]|nr:endonuclease/exonuclease/phosphatase family protein [Mariniphaga sp.]